VLGGDGADVLFGDATYLPAEFHGDDLLDGGAGSDQLFGGGGEDKLYGGDGDDILSGGAGNDLLEGGAGSDSLDAGEGDDMLQAGAGSDTLSGVAGADELHAGAGDDGLDGGEGHDVLHGDGGADRLEGGAGNDTLFGGSGDDLVDGGDGDDVIDGGAGADILRGGEGNDTYWVGLGYGRELIEDSHGENRIRFGPGILPEVLAAELDPATLAVTLSFGAGDAVSLNLGQVEIGVDFSNGTAWTRSRLIDFLPAVASQGSGTSDALVGNPRLKNELRGEAGDDILQGASYADYLAGGDGNDSLDGKSGSDRYFFAADESGVDLLADSGVAARAYLDWFYQSRGIADWAERANRGGQYRVQGERNDDRGQFVEYFDTYEEAYEEHPLATIFHVEPLPELAPLVTRNNAEALAELSGAGVLDEDFVEFGAGLGLSDLELTLAVPASLRTSIPNNPGMAEATCRCAGCRGFDVQIPGSRTDSPARSAGQLARRRRGKTRTVPGAAIGSAKA
jgi:Ca2+-binding RTX toxin-like protein